jgi:hypothetical protein
VRCISLAYRSYTVTVCMYLYMTEVRRESVEIRRDEARISTVVHDSARYGGTYAD